MSKSYSIKFWIVFWSVSTLFLTAWYFYWNTLGGDISKAVDEVVTFLPISEMHKKEYHALAVLGDFMLEKDEREKIFLVLFQNNLEIRPGGGFIGTFAIVKTKNGSITSMETHDLSNFDSRIPNTIEPPYPMKEIDYVSAWKMRDSNWSPDFAVNAEKAEEFYNLGQGWEQFDGVIGLTANMLTSMLKATGPISMKGYPGTYDSENAIISLEYQVEKAFEEQGIDRGKRKSVINELAQEIRKKILTLSTFQKIQLTKVLLQDLRQKDVQLYFKRESLQQIAEEAGWAGRMDENWEGDFLSVIDANLGAYKSDYYVKRSLDYTVDLSKSKPEATLKITYEHTAKQKDWMTKDYLSYLRVYVPKGAWLVSQKNFNNTKFGNEFGKKYFGSIVKVPLGTQKTVELKYTLPENITLEAYNLKIQKQAGINGTPVAVHLLGENGNRRDYAFDLNGDVVLSKIEN